MSASLYCWSGAKGFLADAIACCIPNENGFVLIVRVVIFGLILVW